MSVLAALQGCSWVELFVIYNKSNKAIYVVYELKNDPKGLPIFRNSPSLYKLNADSKIDWSGDSSAIDDEDSELSKVRVAVPPHSALVFGDLHNDRYKSYDQTFINERSFNLAWLQIFYNGNTLEVNPSTFDSHFKKYRGEIQFSLE